jgi:general stress protein CsbA
VKHNRVGNGWAIGCACIGALVGYLGFVALLQRGLYAVILPGGLLGLFAGIPRNRSRFVAVVCSLLAIAAGLLAEYRVAPFVADARIGYFLLHVSDLQPITLLSIGTGGAIGFWVPFRRRIRGV